MGFRGRSLLALPTHLVLHLVAPVRSNSFGSYRSEDQQSNILQRTLISSCSTPEVRRFSIHFLASLLVRIERRWLVSKDLQGLQGTCRRLIGAHRSYFTGGDELCRVDLALRPVELFSRADRVRASQRVRRVVVGRWQAAEVLIRVAGTR